MAPVVDDPRELNLTIDLCLRIGEVLLSSGAGAADVTATMQSVAHHFGLRQPEIDVTFTSLSMSYQASPEEPPVLMIRNVKHRDIDYADLTAGRPPRARRARRTSSTSTSPAPGWRRSSPPDTRGRAGRSPWPGA